MKRNVFAKLRNSVPPNEVLKPTAPASEAPGSLRSPAALLIERRGLTPARHATAITGTTALKSTMRSIAHIAGILSVACAPAIPLRPGEEFVADSATPQGALLVLEAAYRAKDLEAAVRAKDFVREAELMLSAMRSSRDDSLTLATPELLARTAQTLEQLYRVSMGANWPDLNGTKSFFSDTASYAPGIVRVIEEVEYPDGGRSRQAMLVARSSRGWRVLHPVE